jgi:hypothetical protein
MHCLRKKNTPKYFFGKNPIFCIPSQNFLVDQGKYKSSSKTFYFQCLKCFKKENLNVWQTCHDLFYISGVPVWFRSHHLFESCTLIGYRARIMSKQTAPTPHYRQPSRILYGSITFTLMEEHSSIKLPYRC